MKKLLFFTVVLAALAIVPDHAEAQLFKKKDKAKKEKTKKSKKKQGGTAYQGFVPQKALTPEEKKAAMISPVRKMLNLFNLSVEKGYGFFSYQNALSGVTAVRNPAGNDLFLVPGNVSPGSGPVTIYRNWLTDLRSTEIARIDDDAEVVDAANLIYRNSGRLNPLTLRLSFSLRKVDKKHLKRTGERIMTDNELLRVGVGISAGKIKFKNDASTQDVSGRLGDYRLPLTKLSSTKMFGSVSVNVYQYGELSLLADVSAGVWKIRAQDVNRDFATFDPFFNIGLIFEKKVSKYFKVYIRPSFEVRSYSLADEAISVPYKFSVFTIDIGALIKYPVYPRNRYKAHRVQMEHVFNGKIYRGRSIFQRQNPRIGQHGLSRKEKVRSGGNTGN